MHIVFKKVNIDMPDHVWINNFISTFTPGMSMFTFMINTKDSEHLDNIMSTWSYKVDLTANIQLDEAEFNIYIRYIYIIFLNNLNLMDSSIWYCWMDDSQSRFGTHSSGFYSVHRWFFPFSSNKKPLV